MISDCSTGQTVGQLKGHSGHIMSVYADSDDIIASGSADNTVRLWDLRSQRCIDAIATGDSCVASVCVNSSGNMLASGNINDLLCSFGRLTCAVLMSHNVFFLQTLFLVDNC